MWKGMLGTLAECGTDLRMNEKGHQDTQSPRYRHSLRVTNVDGVIPSGYVEVLKVDLERRASRFVDLEDLPSIDLGVSEIQVCYGLRRTCSIKLERHEAQRGSGI